MSEVLSQNEIDELLKALSTGEIDVKQIQEESQSKKARLYDFRRPNKFAKDQLRTLEIIYENFSRLMVSYLSGALRSYCQVDVISVEPQTYHEFNNSLPEPVILGIVDFNPLKGSMIIEISPDITFAMIDRMLGGTGRVTDKIRDFTEIEIVLVERILKQLLLIMNDSWSNVLKTNFKLDRIETNAQFAQIVSPNETIAIITLNVKIGEIEGLVNLCIPHMVIEPIIGKLSTKYWYSSKLLTDISENKTELISRQIEKTSLDVRAILGVTTITVNDFIGIQEGDVIKLDKKVDDDINILIGEIEKFHGIVGLKNQNLAVQITDVYREEFDNDE